MTRRHARPESDRDKYMRIVGALRVLQPLADAAGRNVIAAELEHAAAASTPPPMPEKPVTVLPGRVAAYVEDVDAFMAWAAEQKTNPLLGARLNHAVAADLATRQPIPGLAFRTRPAVALVHVGPAAAIARHKEVSA